MIGPKWRVCGLDLGKSTDHTALTMLEWPLGASYGVPRSYDVPVLYRWPLGTPYAKIGHWVAEFFRSPAMCAADCPKPTLVVDETGVGIPVCEMILSALRMAHCPFSFIAVTITAGSAISLVDDGHWHVAKKQLASILVRLFQTRRLHIANLPERETLIREAQEFSVKITPAGNETFESWRENAHDDLVLSLALAAWHAETADWTLPEPTALEVLW